MLREATPASPLPADLTALCSRLAEARRSYVGLPKSALIRMSLFFRSISRNMSSGCAHRVRYLASLAFFGLPAMCRKDLQIGCSVSRPQQLQNLLGSCRAKHNIPVSDPKLSPASHSAFPSPSRRLQFSRHCDSSMILPCLE